MSFIVIEKTVNETYEFEFAKDLSSFITWHNRKYGHFYQTLNSDADLKALLSRVTLSNEFANQASAELRQCKSIVIASTSVDSPDFEYIAKIFDARNSPSEFEFISSNFEALSLFNLAERLVYPLNNVVKSFDGSKNPLSTSEYAKLLYNFLLTLPDLSGQPLRLLDQNQNPHKAAKLASLVYARHFGQTGVGVMDYWELLSREAKMKCQNIVQELDVCREIWNSEKEPIASNDNELPF